MGEIIPLNSKPPIDIHSDAGRAFVCDATRAGEGVITDLELQERYELSSADLQALASNKAVGKAIRDERERRVRSGLAAKELAAKYFVKSPGILDQIQTHAESPRHKIDAIRELRTTASGGDGDSPSKSELFSIVINLSADGADHVIKQSFDVTPKATPVLEDDGNGWG